MKFALTLPYGDRVFNHEDAIKIIEILERSEIYETTYRSKEDGGTLHYISRGELKGVTLKHVPEELYQIAKMAGPKPD